MIQPRNHTLLSRTNTTAAELYYLRHMRLCAAAAMGNKGGNPSPSTALQISGASFIGRLLQSICRRCYLTIFLPVDRLLQSIGQMLLYYAKIAMKLMTPLELAACLHLAEAYMHRDFPTYLCEASHCEISAVSAPSAQKIATIALALLTLILSIMDWHVPRGVPGQQMLCRILTAMSMQALEMNVACIAIAFWLPTFGKRPREEGSTTGKRTVTTSPATEQTPRTPTDTKVTVQNSQSSTPMQPSSSAVESDAATEHIQPGSTLEALPGSSAASADVAITSIDDVVSKLALEHGESALVLCNAARTLQTRVQAQIRNLCKPCLLYTSDAADE